MSSPRFYLVVAYRWGFTNDDWYIVYGGPDREKACRLAVEERNGRGDKYGCAVHEFSEDGRSHERIAYETSIYCEREP